MMRLQHPNCLTILDVYRDQGRAPVWDLVLPLMRGGELYERVKHGALPEEDARGVLAQVNTALDYLHGKGGTPSLLNPRLKNTNPA